MGSYYAPYFGDALVLNTDEFKAFTAAYQARHNLSDARIEQKIEELYDAEWKAFGSEGMFEIVPVMADEADGMQLIPIRYGGEENRFVKNPDGGKPLQKLHIVDMRGQDCYAIFAGKDRFLPQAIASPPYKDAAELEQEFKTLLGGYLPDGFCYGSHIGVFSYALFG